MEEEIIETVENDRIPIVVKYNNDLEFRKQVAFCRAYRTINYKPRFFIELILTVLMVAAAVLLLTTDKGRQLPAFFLYGTLLIGIYLLVKLLRIWSNVSKIQDDDMKRGEREFAFDERGFVFGPVGAEGKMLDTTWNDIDKVLIGDGIIYISAMQRRHFAAVDSNKLVRGSWDDLIGIIDDHMEKRRVKHLVK